MKQYFLLVVLSLWNLSQVQAQLYTERKNQHRFAQTYLGLGAQYAPSGGQLFWNDGQSAFPHMVAPRLTIGGLHFWGHVDFQMNFALSHLTNRQLDPQTQFEYSSGSDLNVRFYPWAIKFGAIRPYVGIGVNFTTFTLDHEFLGFRGDIYMQTTATAGLSFAFKNWQVNAEANWFPFNKKTFYTNHQDAATMVLPPLYVSLGVARYFDVTLREEKGMESGSTLALEEELKADKKLSCFSIGIGASTTFFLSAPKFSTGARASVPRHKSEIHPDLGIGYFFHRANMHVGLSYRWFQSGVESYGVEHLIRRQSLAIEGYKFLLNYKGFVPFVGLTIGLERWAMAEFIGNEQVGATQRTQMIAPGLIFGWDILASPLETWVLRTNLRYYPFQTITDVEGKQSRVDQFEFNFIQAVFYPQRMVHIPKAKKAAKEAGAIF